MRGPNQDLLNSPAFPSGHTTYGTTESMILAILVPARYQQMVTRAAEYGNDRIVVGAHYAMDVIGGRTTSLHALAHLLANDPAYVGQIRTNPAVLDQASADTSKTVTLADYPAVVKDARAEIEAFVAQTCGRDVAACAGEDTSRFRDPAANAAFVASTRTYGLPVVHPETAGKTEDVAALAPEAGHLLTAAFPELSLAEANRILTETQGPGGGFLDDGSEFGVYSRLDLYAAAGRAASLAASRRAGGRPPAEAPRKKATSEEAARSLGRKRPRRATEGRRHRSPALQN
ncbi:phosphatase PAP2 family protein [Methylobacterium persicinum]